MDNQRIEFATKAIILNNGKYLALHKTKEKYNLYELPGGRMEFGEAAEETIIREVREETNYIVEPVRLLDTWNYIVSENHQITGVIFLCKIKEGNFKLSDEHDGYQWLKLDSESIDLMHDVYKERMINWDMKEIKRY